MENFDTAVTVTPASDGSYIWVVPEGWAVGRGAWGGLVIGSLISAIEQSETDRARVVRAVSGEIASPARVGPHVVAVTLSRRGSALSTWTATTTNDNGELVARLTAVLALPRQPANDVDDSTWGMLEAPTAPPPAEAVRFEMGGLGPQYMGHLQLAPSTGIIFSGNAARTTGYVRLTEPVAHSASSLLALVDGWWPASLVPFEQFQAMATVSFSANLMVDPSSVPADEWLLHDGFAAGARDGFVSEQRRLWSVDGRLLVDNMQSMVLLK